MKALPMHPPLYATYAPTRTSASGGEYKAHESLAKAKASITYQGYGKIFVWSGTVSDEIIVGKWVVLYDIPRPDDWYGHRRYKIDWDQYRVVNETP